MESRNPTVKGERPGGRAAAVQAAVRDAALELLAEAGYDGLRLPEVARRAGVHKTTVYRRWPTRAHLVAALAADLARERVEMPDTGDLVGDLQSLLVQVAAMLRMPSIRAVLAALVAGPPDEDADALRTRFWDERFGTAEAIVDRAVARGELPAGTDPRGHLERVVGPLYFRVLVLGRDVGEEEIAALARAGAR